MCPACLTQIFGAVAGPATGGVGALVLLWRRCNSAKPIAEPPTPTFQEWIAAIVGEKEQDEDLGVSTVRGSEWVSVQTLEKPNTRSWQEQYRPVGRISTERKQS